VFTGHLQPNELSSLTVSQCPTPELAVILLTDAAAAKLMSVNLSGKGDNPLMAMMSQLGRSSTRVLAAFPNAVGLWLQGRDGEVPAGAHLLDNIQVEPHPEHPLTEPMKV
jgi:hypothetical protein